ncbi:hypothetical protein CKY39_10490 [Variovorax boronicumulans]|uniref:Uncharacterized protein n=1 Tax=Variovorax boronicumulans TaxID=436515 RepID=A0A250DGT1_9BURK|nr:hypothetical protein [Variovorax boronicumulans]ATA53597.1 hypothetical protein CKY39_10490 [Variovorax boronicumulans]
MITAKKKHSPKREILRRQGVIEDWGLSLYAMSQGGKAIEERRREEQIYMTVGGTLTEAVNGVLAFDFQIIGSTSPAAGRAEIPSVGSITGMKPKLQAGMELSLRQFDVLLSIARAGRLKSCRFSFLAPRYGSSLIASVSFSTSPPEGME